MNYIVKNHNNDIAGKADGKIIQRLSTDPGATKTFTNFVVGLILSVRDATRYILAIKNSINIYYIHGSESDLGGTITCTEDTITVTNNRTIEIHIYTIITNPYYYR